MNTEFQKELSAKRDEQLNTIIGHIERSIGQPVDKAEFKHNLTDFIRILHETLQACAQPTITDRVDSLLKIKDPRGEPILQNNRKWAEEIVGDNTPFGNRCEEFVKLNNEIIMRHNQLKAQLKNPQSPVKGGFKVDDSNFTDMKGPAVDSELQKLIDAKLKKSPISRTFEVTGNILIVLGRMVNPFYMYNFYKRYQLLIDPLLVIPKTLLDFILFPLYTLENIPVIGGIIGIPMDFVGIMIDASDLLFKLVAPFVPGVIATLLDILKAIPVVGTVVSIVSIPLNFAMPIVQNLVANLASIMGFFLAIARKNFSQAYFYALNFIPFMGSIMRLATRFLYTINRIMSYVNKTMDQFGVINKMNKAFSENPKAMNDPLEFIKSVLLKNAGTSESIDRMVRRLVAYTPAVLEFNKAVKSKKDEIIGAWPNEDIEPLGTISQTKTGGRHRYSRRNRLKRRRSSIGRRSK